MKVKTIIRFRDLEQNTVREIGDTFDVSAQRAELLVRAHFVEKITEPKKPAAE